MKSAEPLVRGCLEIEGCPRSDLCPLNRVRAGAAVRIKQLTASTEVTQRLRELGLGEEQLVRLLTSQTNIICLVCNARLAISAQLAQVILVEAAPEQIAA